MKQRLKLACVAPAVFEVYAEDGMTFEQLMAFTVTPVQDSDGADAMGQGGDISVSSWKPSRTSAGGTVITSSGQLISAYASEEEDDGALKPLPERLVIELTDHRTLALREAIGRSPDVALTLLLLKLVTDTFRTSSASGSCLEASVRHVYMSAQAPDLKDSVLAKLLDERHADCEADLPLGDDAALWDYLSVLDQGRRLALLAHCLSFGINTLHEKVNPYGAGISASGLTRRMAYADLVARAVDLDMVEAGWEPTGDGYLNRVPKARILEAVREAKGAGTAQLLDHLKMGEMATEAEPLLKGNGWLPEVLRRPDLAARDGEKLAERQGEDAGQPDGIALHRPAVGGPGAAPRHARGSRLPGRAQALLPADALRACRATGGKRQFHRLIARNHPFIPIEYPAPRPGLPHPGGPHGGLLHPFLVRPRSRQPRQSCPRARAVLGTPRYGSGRRRPGGRGLHRCAPGRARGQQPLDT